MLRDSNFEVAAALGLIALIGAGCQSYVSKPPDLDAHHQVWMERSPAGVEVVAFAESLREAGAMCCSSDPAVQFSIADAELVALVFNADLRLARSLAGVTRATLDQEGLWDDPVLSVGLERMLSGGPNPWMAMTSVGFTLPVSGRLKIEKQLAGAAHYAALHALLEQEWRVRMDVRRAWVRWSATFLQRDVTEEFLERLDRIVGIVTRMEEIGELARVQGRLFHIEQAQRRNDLRELESEMVERGLALRQLMGLSPTTPLQPMPQIVFEVIDHSGDAAAVIRERHPRLRTLQAEHEAAERTLEMAIRRQYPDVTIGPGYNYEDGASRALVGFSLPLPIFNRNRQQIAEAMAEREHALAVVEIAYESLVNEFFIAEVQLSAVTDQLDRMTDTIIPLVDQQYVEARRIAELGEVDTLLLLDTLRRQYEAKLDLIGLETNRSLLGIRKAELLGPPSDDLAWIRREQLIDGRKESEQ